MEFCITFLAGAATMHITTGFPVRLVPAVTAESKVVELRTRYEKVKARHAHFMKFTKPRIPAAHAETPEFLELGKRTFLMESFEVRLDKIEDKISSGGINRFFPHYLKDTLTFLVTDLDQLDLNTSKTTNAAEAVLAELLKYPESRAILYGECTKKDSGKDEGENGAGGVGTIEQAFGSSFTTSSQKTH